MVGLKIPFQNIAISPIAEVQPGYIIRAPTRVLLWNLFLLKYYGRRHFNRNSPRTAHVSTFINDLPYQVSSQVCLFADNCLLYIKPLNQKKPNISLRQT